MKEVKRRILIIEDDRDIVDLVAIHIADIGADLLRSYDGLSGLELAQNENIDLIILDVMLPGLNGVEVCRRLRASGNQTPILMLTAKSEEIDKVIGLETGADDYLTKPFGMRELMARINAILRRASKSNHESAESNVQKGELMVDFDMQKVELRGQRVDISKREFELLKVLISHPGKSYSRSNLLKLIWGYDFDGYEHTVNSHINRLRAKIESDPGKPSYILTTWGVGYRFNESI